MRVSQRFISKDRGGYPKRQTDGKAMRKTITCKNRQRQEKRQKIRKQKRNCDSEGQNV